MLLNESMKSSNISHFQQNDGGMHNVSATSTIGITTAAVSSSSTTLSGTPLRSRNSNRDRQQSDDKLENSNVKGKNPPKPMDEFYKDLQQFHEKRGTPIMHMPKITGRQIDLHRLYCEVTERGGFQKVNMRDDWDEILPELGLKEKMVNGSTALKYIYRRVLEKYERLNYFGEDPDKADASEAAEMAEFSMGGGRGRGSRYPSSYSSSNPTIIHNVAMSYNYRQHHVNMERRRQFNLSTDLHKPSAYEKLMLSLLSPLPNEQDFAINACTLMANESRHTLKLNEYPKILDALLAHTGVFSDYTMRKLFQHIYSGVRHHSLYGFWYDLLSDKPQIMDLYTDEQALRGAALVDDYDDGKPEMEGIWQDCNELDFLNLRTGLGTQDYVGQRVLQVVSILRNLSFQEENLGILVKNKTFLRFLVMSSNIRWSNVHIQALEIAGNIAGELEISDPTIDDLSRCLMATLCDGVEGPDRGVIINCLEILYKLCQKDTNEDFVLKCLNPNFYNTLSLFLSLNDIMLLLFTLEAIYALTCLGSKSCHSMMQVKGIVDQLISLITVEAQAYGPDGCILMRVVETVPGNMLPLVAQNIVNLQNVATIQKQTNQTVISHNQIKPQISVPIPMQPTEILESTAEQQNKQMDNDERYALSWMINTFECTPSIDSHIEAEELYRMYLSHCQKSGKHSVVPHTHFPKLVRHLYTAKAGPAAVKKADGTDLPGLHYMHIKLRAQPLSFANNANAPTAKQTESPGSARKPKKKLKQQMETAETAAANNLTLPASLPSVESKSPASTNVNATAGCTAAENVTENIKPEINAANMVISQPSPQFSVTEEKVSEQIEIKTEEKMDIDEKPDIQVKLESEAPTTMQTAESESLNISDATSMANAGASQNPSSSLIKSLLANKVNQRQLKQKDSSLIPNTPTTTVNAPPTLSSTVVTSTPQPIKVASTAITALVNNPLMQHTPVKVGQTTIKPLNPHPVIMDKKSIISESTPPPLAPLSGANVAKDSSGRPILLANQMLVDILDKKMVDPPIPGSIIQKRKIEDHSGNNKRMAFETSSTLSSNTSSVKEETQVTPSKNAANLYAEMAASILEDEDLEEFSAQQQAPQLLMDQKQMQQTSLIIPAKVQQQNTSLQAVPRQLVFQSNQPQLKLTQPVTSGGQQMPNAVATIKTDQGLQTVPVILQQNPRDMQQQAPTQIIQQMIQPAPQSQPTYVLATNQQGQTYLVAQQPAQQPPQPPPQPTQTVLVTQTPQQQSTGQKTIIILQQQPMPGQQQQIITTGPPGQGQKMIMTTSQGQQVLVTQRPQTPQQIFINPQTGTATHIQHVPVQNPTRQIIQASTTQQQPQPQSQQIQAGQISPSLLNQLNQIPATIKLHQPIAQTTTPAPQPQPATITRMSKTVSLVQSNTPTTPVAIPQLQQHQSIIQQHIISGPSEKRHVILSGGGAPGGMGMRAIEIKETVITQAQQPPQQCQLNSQTIITTQQPSTVQGTGSTTPPLLQQQVQQQIRAVIEQQQHPSIIQQKISSLPVVHQPKLQTSTSSSSSAPQQQLTKTQSQVMVQTSMAASKHKPPLLTQQQQTPSLVAAKLPDPTPSLIQSKIVNQSQNAASAVVSSIPTTSQSPALGNVKKPVLVKPSLPTVKLPPIVNSSGPPPLAAVNTNPSENATKTSVVKTTCNTQNTTDANKKEEQSGNIQTTTVGQGNGKSIPPTKALPTQTTAPSTISTPTITNNTSAKPMPATPSDQSQSENSQNSTPSQTQQAIQTPLQNSQVPDVDLQWLYVCDWRNCRPKQFKSLGDLQHHVCKAHAPSHLEPGADIFCQWGIGPSLCDGLTRKRFSLMTHLMDHHLSMDSLKAAVQRRVSTGMFNITPALPPVTIVRNKDPAQRANNASPSPANPNLMTNTALETLKRRTANIMNSKELLDENEGPVTKSIRLTASLILRNLVTYTSTAKRSVRRYESHLANIALSNVESSGTISHILYEMNG